MFICYFLYARPLANIYNSHSEKKMIELKKEDIEKLDLLLEIISEYGFFGITSKGVEHKNPSFFYYIKAKNSIESTYSIHIEREYERLASFFKNFDCGNVKNSVPFENGQLSISKNHNTIQFKNQGGFKNEFNKQQIKFLRENKQDEILDLDITLKRFESKIGKKLIIFTFIISFLSFLITVLTLEFWQSDENKNDQKKQVEIPLSNKKEEI